MIIVPAISCSPIAELLTLMLIMLTVILVDDALLRTNTGCTDPSLSTTLYDDSLKNTVIATRLYICMPLFIMHAANH